MASLTPRSVHRALGIAMLLPLLAWAVTGAIFFIKPGYGGAYESLAVRTYPLTSPLSVPPSADWREVRYLKTVLGDHLIARTETGWKQFDPVTLQERPSPSDADVRALVTDALTTNPTRYGQIGTVDGTRIITDTVSLIRSRGHFPRGGYDVHNGSKDGYDPAETPAAVF